MQCPDCHVPLEFLWCTETEAYYSRTLIDGKYHHHDGNTETSRFRCTSCQSDFESARHPASCPISGCEWNTHPAGPLKKVEAVETPYPSSFPPPPAKKLSDKLLDVETRGPISELPPAKPKSGKRKLEIQSLLHDAKAKKTTTTGTTETEVRAPLLPSRATPGAAGYDLFLPESRDLPAATKAVAVPLGFKMKVPDGHVALILDRSSMVKNGLKVEAGVIDGDYRGEVAAMMWNHSGETQSLLAGQRIAQMLLVKISTPEVEQVQELDKTERGEGGFGSTGK